ncbi:hypothetical protein [Duganella sp. Root1480D1]|uniref:hypothetical protein n=1 Tax=Duganella sp. Root1480D1 TaxID=1736471 RepID=UPI0007107200|nr:hypothetical protein [Duganella sp. Root1480D1]KQZ28756.1 hypothetical protein ASD58_30210 [Duganella sp. Root1480D1]
MKFDDVRRQFRHENTFVVNQFNVLLDDLLLFANDENNAAFFGTFQAPDNEDMLIIRQSYENLMPFVVEIESGQHDIYCYDFEQVSQPQVVTFSDHAIVNRWDSVQDFINWLEIAISKAR